jgi:hypothetical protein
MLTPSNLLNRHYAAVLSARPFPRLFWKASVYKLWSRRKGKNPKIRTIYPDPTIRYQSFGWNQSCPIPGSRVCT